MQRIPPFSASLVFAVERFMREALQLEKPWPLCVAAVSGGADSTALMQVMRLLDVPMLVAHLDHGLRPESAAEARHVAEMARSLGLECSTEREDVRAFAEQEGLGLEDAGRRCRYAMLERVRQAAGAEWILTGHHLDDLSEDILLRLIRGAGWPALGGMRARDDRRRLLRPLLHTGREALERFLTELGHTWCEDASNQDTAVRRNRIRHAILPFIRAENPAFDQAARRLWLAARLDEAYWDRLLPQSEPAACPAGSNSRPNDGPGSRTDAQNTLLLEKAVLDELTPAARLRLLYRSARRISEATGRGQARLDALFRLEELWQKRQTGSIVQMPGVEARITRSGICFRRSRQGR